MLAAGVAAAMVVGLRWAIGRSGWARSTDESTLRWVLEHRSALLTSAFRMITALGDVRAVIPLIVISAALLMWRGRRDLAAVLVASSVGTWVVVNTMKLMVHRPRPPQSVRLVTASGWSFPSGHAGQAAAAYLALALLFAVTIRRTWVAVVVLAAGAVIAVLIGASRVYLGVHWLSDVIAGWAVAIAWLAVLLAVLSWRRRTSYRALLLH
mgnify:FL=1